MVSQAESIEHVKMRSGGGPLRTNNKLNVSWRVDVRLRIDDTARDEVFTYWPEASKSGQCKDLWQNGHEVLKVCTAEWDSVGKEMRLQQSPFGYLTVFI